MEPAPPSDPNTALRRLEELSNNMIRLSTEFRRVVDEARELCSRQVERMQRDREAAVLAARVEAQVAALQPDSASAADSTLQPAMDNENHKKVNKTNRFPFHHGFGMGSPSSILNQERCNKYILFFSVQIVIEKR